MNNGEEDYIDDAFDDDNYDDDQKNSLGQDRDGMGEAAANVGNGKIQNHLVDKEVEQVIMKSASHAAQDKKKPNAGGYAIPDDDDEPLDDDENDDEDEDVDEDDEEIHDDPDAEMEDEEDIDR